MPSQSPDLVIHIEPWESAMNLEHGVSNALTEGLNSKIEAVKRSACGFKNKESLRNAILFHCGKLNLLPEAAN